MAADLTAGNIGSSIGPVFDQVITIAGWIVQLLIILGVVWYVYIVLTFNVKLTVRKMSKGGRIIAYETRAKKWNDPKTSVPKIQFFGKLGFQGRRINEPPSECLIPYKSFLGTKLMYDLVEKDGIFYPVQNVVLGKKYEGTDDEGNAQSFHSIKGSGLEISRDYDSEQAIQNNLIDYATKYRNKKPIEIAAMYGLMIVVIIGSVVVMVYAWKQFGNIASAIYELREPLTEVAKEAVSQKLGPG